MELAGSQGEIANDTLQGEFRNIRPEEAQIFLVEAGPRILAPYPPALSAKAQESAHESGRPDPDRRARRRNRREWRRPGDLRDAQAHRFTHRALGGRCSAVGVGRNTSRGDRRGAGSRGTDHGGARLEHTPAIPRSWVLGDLAGATTAGTRAEPAVAPVAMQHGRYAARLIEARLKGESVGAFSYHNRGSMATIGRASAVAVVAGLTLSGWSAWITWLFVHLMYLVGFQNRLLVFIQWAFQYPHLQPARPLDHGRAGGFRARAGRAQAGTRHPPRRC